MKTRDLDFDALAALPADRVAEILLSRRPRRTAARSDQAPRPRSPISAGNERAIVPATPEVAPATRRVARSPSVPRKWARCPECGRLASATSTGEARTCAPCADALRGPLIMSGEVRVGRCTEHRDRTAVATTRLGALAWLACRECAETANRLRGNPSGGYDPRGGSA